MAKKKEQKDLYGGFDLFDFMSDEIETGLEILESNSTAVEEGKNDVHESGELQDDRGNNNRQGNDGDTSIRSDRKSTGQKIPTTLFATDFGEVVSDVSGINGETERHYVTEHTLRTAEDRTENFGRLQDAGGDEKRSESGRDITDERSEPFLFAFGDRQRREILSEDVLKKSGEKRDYNQIAEIVINGNKDKYAKNIAAIRLLKQLETENRYPTGQEQITLVSYSGWGGLPQVFDPKNATWRAEYEELRDLLNPKEYEAARASTTSSFYTPKLLVDTIYKALDKFGLSNTDEQKLILEPSAGAGAFIAFSNYKNVKFE